MVTYRNEDTIGPLMASLAQLPDVAVAVHDNGPEALTLPVARQAAEAAGIPFRGESCTNGNCGFGAGCNRLAASSQAGDLVFLNPDATVLAWPNGLTAAGRIVGAAVSDAHGQPARLWGTGRTLWDEIRLRWLRRPPRPPAGRGYVSGAALLVDRNTFARLGGFDESYFMYYEDIDLCHRANAAGVSVEVEPGWQVRHEGGHSVGRSTEAVIRAQVISYRSARRFHATHGRGRAFDVIAALDGGMRALLFRLLPGRGPDAAAHGAVARLALSALVGRRAAD